MKTFVTGATGALGWPAVDALVGAGHQVTALARTPEKAAALRERGATPVSVSLFDTDALARACAGHNAIANLATALPATHRFTSLRAWNENNRVRTEGSRSVAEAARSAGVPVLIQESVAMIYPDSGDRWITEETKPDRFPMAESNLAAEANTQRFTDQGGTGVILRLGWFYGPGAAHSEQFFSLAERHVCIQMGSPQGYVSSIHVHDAGRAIAAAVDVPAGTYNIVDDEPLTKAAYADALATAARRRCWIRVPGRSAYLLGHRTTSLTRSLRVSNARFKQFGAWEPAFPSAREGWVCTAQGLQAPDSQP